MGDDWTEVTVRGVVIDPMTGDPTILLEDSEETAIIGDRMDTDIIAGVEAEITTVLVLSGVTQREDLSRYAYQPDYILDGVGDLLPES